MAPQPSIERDSPQSKEIRRYLISNSSITALWRGLGVASGVALDSAVLAIFGFGALTDAFFAALALPLALSSTLEIQLPKTLVPVISRKLEKGKDQAWNLLSRLLFVSLCASAVTAVLMSALAGKLLTAQVPGLEEQSLHSAASLLPVLSWL
ncbi:MAG: hypothetical protein V3T83_16890, partial [Acidobacteriota bacterium]